MRENYQLPRRSEELVCPTRVRSPITSDSLIENRSAADSDSSEQIKSKHRDTLRVRISYIFPLLLFF